MEKHDNQSTIFGKAKESIAAFALALSLGITIFNVVASVFNFAVANKFQPVAQNLLTITSRVEAVETNQSKFVTKEVLDLTLKPLVEGQKTENEQLKELIRLHLQPNTR